MYITSNDQYICCDNETGDAWVEEFDNLITATKWLNGLIEVGEALELARKTIAERCELHDEN